MNKVAWEDGFNGHVLTLQMDGQLLNCDTWMDLSDNGIAIDDGKTYMEAVLASKTERRESEAWRLGFERWVSVG